jgi:probable HAF family extracellular repeat protein
MKNNTPFFLFPRPASVLPKLAMMLLVGASLLSAERAHAQVTFTGLGTLGGGSSANGVSADGSVVVGNSNSQAFRWTSSGMVGLGFLSTDFNSSARGVSADGSVVVGYSNGSTGYQAVRWASSSIESLGILGGTYNYAYGVSGDGNFVVGFSNGQAFRWNATSNTMVSLGNIGGTSSYAYGVSGDGSVVVGEAEDADGNYQAFRWNATSNTMTGLGFLGTSTYSYANAVSADGNFVVGGSEDSSGNDQAVRWTSSGIGWTSSVIESLGTLGGTSSYAYGVSGDGSVVVGSSNDSSNNQQAFLWNETTGGMMSLYDTLVSSGADLTGWLSLGDATGISSDGTTIVGTGTRSTGVQEAFVARNPSGWGSVSGSGVSAPEPGTLSLLGVSGIVGLVAKKRRARK